MSIACLNLHLPSASRDSQTYTVARPYDVYTVHSAVVNMGGLTDCFIILLVVINCTYGILVHKKFEYKYSFKPPYLAQKDGSVPFWEYGGSKYLSCLVTRRRLFTSVDTSNLIFSLSFAYEMCYIIRRLLLLMCTRI